MRDDFLLHMRSHPLFDIFLEDLLSHRPAIPSHNAKNDNTEIWKSESAKQEGFDLCLTYFGIGVTEE